MGSWSIRSSFGEVDQNGIRDNRDVMCRSLSTQSRNESPQCGFDSCSGQVAWDATSSVERKCRGCRTDQEKENHGKVMSSNRTLNLRAPYHDSPSVA